MRSQIRRYFWAALLSGCGFAATLLWYNSTEKKVESIGEFIAQVGDVGDDVKRKLPTSQSWFDVRKGDNLYDGESIRTTNSEISIRFMDGRFINLEKDSLIILQKTKGEIALNLMEGSLFVNAQTQNNETGTDSKKSAPALVLNSARGKVDLSGASASLTKNGANDFNLEVTDGQAKIQGKDGQSQEISKGARGNLGDKGFTFNQQNIQILSPKTEKPVYIDPSVDPKITFQWKGFPPQTKISLWVGERRKELKEISSSDPNLDKIVSRLPIGKHYWKLVATDPKSQKTIGESGIYKLEILERFAPTLIFPTADAQITLEKSTLDMSFKWQAGSELKQTILEIATDPQLKNKIITKALSQENQFTVPQLKEGKYFWRLSAFYAGSEKPFSSQIQSFLLQKSQQVSAPKELARISWVTPETATVQYFLKDPLLQMSWSAETRKDEIVQWRFKAQELEGSEASAIHLDTQEPQVKAAMPKSGQFRIAVEGLNKKGEVIGKSSERVISLATFPLLKSPQIMPFKDDLKALEDGQSEIKWQPVAGAKEYILVVKNNEGKELVRKKYLNQMAKLKKLTPGKYQVQVLAIDQYGRQSPETEPQSLLIPELSKIRAPSNIRVKVNDE